MSDPASPRAKIVSHRPGGTEATDKGPQKNFWRFMPCNPLISLDSDERIQGNPIADKRGFRGEQPTRQENPNASLASCAALPRSQRPKRAGGQNLGEPCLGPNAGAGLPDSGQTLSDRPRRPTFGLFGQRAPR